jgi:transcription-repair coupling factor (superfamily II helicase)
LVTIKSLCRRAHVEKLEAGAKGLTLAFRDNSFADPAKLVKWVASQGALARVRPDMRIVVVGEFDELPERLAGTLKVMREIAAIAAKKEPGAKGEGAPSRAGKAAAR